MKRWFVLPIVLYFSICAWAQTLDVSDARAFNIVKVIRAGVLIDGESGSARRNQVIIVRGSLISSVSDVASAHTPAGAEIIDLSHATVLPGLIDAHTHIFLQGEEPDQGGYDIQLLKHPLAFRAARATVSVRRALEQGFTTLRDMETEGAGYGSIVRDHPPGVGEARPGRIPSIAFVRHAYHHTPTAQRCHGARQGSRGRFPP